MRIIKPSVEFITPVKGDVILRRIEARGRVCYKSGGQRGEVLPGNHRERPRGGAGALRVYREIHL